MKWLSMRLSILASYLLVFFYGNTAFAAYYYPSKDSLQGYIALLIGFINYLLLPFIFSIALLFFIVNTARYFILDGEDKEKARTFALYGIAAFVVLVSIWGIVNVLVSGLGFDNGSVMCPDYLGDACNSSSGGFNVNFNLYFNPGSGNQQDPTQTANCYYDYNLGQKVCQ